MDMSCRLPVYTHPFKPIEHIVMTKLSFQNLSPLYTGPKRQPFSYVLRLRNKVDLTWRRVI
jgi:hypothetical protein